MELAFVVVSNKMIRKGCGTYPQANLSLVCFIGIQ